MTQFYRIFFFFSLLIQTLFATAHYNPTADLKTLSEYTQLVNQSVQAYNQINPKDLSRLKDQSYQLMILAKQAHAHAQYVVDSLNHHNLYRQDYRNQIQATADHFKQLSQDIEQAHQHSIRSLEYQQINQSLDELHAVFDSSEQKKQTHVQDWIKQLKPSLQKAEQVQRKIQDILNRRLSNQQTGPNHTYIDELKPILEYAEQIKNRFQQQIDEQIHTSKSIFLDQKKILDHRIQDVKQHTLHSYEQIQHLYDVVLGHAKILDELHVLHSIDPHFNIQHIQHDQMLMRLTFQYDEFKKLKISWQDGKQATRPHFKLINRVYSDMDALVQASQQIYHQMIAHIPRGRNATRDAMMDDMLNSIKIIQKESEQIFRDQSAPLLVQAKSAIENMQAAIHQSLPIMVEDAQQIVDYFNFAEGNHATFDRFYSKERPPYWDYWILVAQASLIQSNVNQISLNPIQSTIELDNQFIQFKSKHEKALQILATIPGRRKMGRGSTPNGWRHEIIHQHQVWHQKQLDDFDQTVKRLRQVLLEQSSQPIGDNEEEALTDFYSQPQLSLKSTFSQKTDHIKLGFFGVHTLNLLKGISWPLSPFGPLPIAYGQSWGGDSLYTGQKYQYALNLSANNLVENKPHRFIIKVFNRKDVETGSSLVLKPLDVFEIELPMVPQPADIAQGNNRFKKWGNDYLIGSKGILTVEGRLKDLFGFMTTIELDYDQSKKPQTLIITHEAKQADFIFIIELQTSDSDAFLPAYALSFNHPLPSYISYVQVPSLFNPAQPLAYAALPKKASSSTGETGFLVPQHLPNPEDCLALGQSPELIPHPLLNRLVDQLDRNPIALANYVLNEIDLIQAAGHLPSSINNPHAFWFSLLGDQLHPGLITRGALGTYLEKQGNPWEQCALLIYLLRQAGYPAAYAYCNKGEIKVQPQTAAKITKMMLNEEASQAWINLDYPWVVFWDEHAQTWRSIFPWLKDIDIVEGLNIIDYMPESCSNVQQWVDLYLKQPHLLHHDAANNPNDTAFRLFKEGVKKRLKNGEDIDQIGVQYRSRRSYRSSWADFPEPEKIEGLYTIEPHLKDRNDLFVKVDIQICSAQNPSKQITLKAVPFAQLHHRSMYVYFEPFSNQPEEKQHWMVFKINPFDETGSSPAKNDLNPFLNLQTHRLSLDQSDKNINISMSLNKDESDHLSTDQKTLSIQKGTTAALCMVYGHVTQAWIDLHQAYFKHHNKNHSTDDADAQGRLCSILGLSYFKAILDDDREMKKLFKLAPDISFGIGLAKLSPEYKAGSKNKSKSGDFIGKPDLIYPQVDMMFTDYESFKNDCLHTKKPIRSSFATHPVNILGIVNGSSWEHQILNDVFHDKYAISTVKLLQLAHMRADRAKSGFLLLTQSNLKDFIDGRYPDLAIPVPLFKI